MNKKQLIVHNIIDNTYKNSVFDASQGKAVYKIVDDMLCISFQVFKNVPTNMMHIIIPQLKEEAHIRINNALKNLKDEKQIKNNDIKFVKKDFSEILDETNGSSRQFKTYLYMMKQFYRID